MILSFAFAGLFLVGNNIFANQSLEFDELEDGVIEKKARNAYCQIWGDRTGCKNDPRRTCDEGVFCN